VVGLEHIGGDSELLSYGVGCVGKACDVDGIGLLSAECEIE
jgi:hypothetical protein